MNATHHRSSGRTRTVARAAGGERGAVIILALVFIVVIGTMTVFLLSYAFTGTKSLAAYRIERTRRYTADSALHVAVKRLSLVGGATLGTTVAQQCARYALPVDSPDNNVRSVVGPSAYVTVWCYPTPGVTYDPVDIDGGQAPRDVTFEVRCNTAAAQDTTNGKLMCGSGANLTVIGTARVRFENDYDNTAGVDRTKRARVPKILSWQIRT